MTKDKLIKKWTKEIKSNNIKMQLYSECQTRYEELKSENNLISSILRDVKKLNEATESEVIECESCINRFKSNHTCLGCNRNTSLKDNYKAL